MIFKTIYRHIHSTQYKYTFTEGFNAKSHRCGPKNSLWFSAYFEMLYRWEQNYPTLDGTLIFQWFFNDFPMNIHFHNVYTEAQRQKQTHARVICVFSISQLVWRHTFCKKLQCSVSYVVKYFFIHYIEYCIDNSIKRSNCFLNPAKAFLAPASKILLTLFKTKATPGY